MDPDSKLLVAILKNPNGENIFMIQNQKQEKVEGYALLACDLIRNIAKAFNKPESYVWEWVDKERYNQTTNIRVVRR